MQQVDLASVVDASINAVRPAADAKGIDLQRSARPAGGPVGGDPNRLQQVFWNLLTNAVKFTPKDGRVSVTLERVNSHLEVSVTDTGEGIDPAFLPHVFDRFRQADASTTRRHGGLGLGLSIVKQLVELHGGNINATSAGGGKGSTFTVALPVLAVDVYPARAPPRARAASASAVPARARRGEPYANLEGVKVLVVDDEPDARALIERLLQECDASVTTAGSASEAMAQRSRDKPDVLVSDIGMPKRRRLRLDPADPQARAATRRPNSGDRADCLRTRRRPRQGASGRLSARTCRSPSRRHSSSRRSRSSPNRQHTELLTPPCASRNGLANASAA